MVPAVFCFLLSRPYLTSFEVGPLFFLLLSAVPMMAGPISNAFLWTSSRKGKGINSQEVEAYGQHQFPSALNQLVPIISDTKPAGSYLLCKQMPDP